MLLFRPSTDEIILNHYKENSILTFDVPMVYVTNCSQCSPSSKAQNNNTFLVPQTFLFEPLMFLDEFTIREIPPDETFTIEEVFTNHPHGLEASFRNDVTYFVVTDTQGITSVTYQDIDNFIIHDEENRYPENTFLLHSIANQDVFWIKVDLNEHMYNDYTETTLPHDQAARTEKILAVENEFLSKFPSNQILEYDLDQNIPRVYLKMDSQLGVLYLLAGKVRFNISSLGLMYTDIDDLIIKQ